MCFREELVGLKKWENGILKEILFDIGVKLQFELRSVCLHFHHHTLLVLCK